MHWHILGAGAIGCLWADFLTRTGQDVSLILRNHSSLAHWAENGPLELRRAKQAQRSLPAGNP